MLVRHFKLRYQLSTLMSCFQIARERCDISEDKFVREYVLRSRPVMLEDCLGAETRAALEKVTTGRFIRSSAVND